MANKRAFFQEGLNSELTQGSVFFGAYTEDYITQINYGLIITARCDISQDKTPVYSYLPLVSFENWLCVEFPSVLYKKIYKQVYSNLVTSFEQIGGTQLLLETYSIDQLADIFSNDSPKGKFNKFVERADSYNLAQELLKPNISVDVVKKIILSFKKDSEKIIEELISQNLLGYYFIDDVTNDGAHVLKLRDVYHIKSEYAKCLRNGVSLPNVTYSQDDPEKVSFTVGVISSPYIEHILQKFSTVYGRIGIDDPDKNIIKELIGE